jgi:hypothetical protein
MAAPGYIQKGSADFGDGLTINPLYPVSIQEGDFIFLVAFSQQLGATIGAINTPAGFTPVGGAGMVNSLSQPLGGMSVFMKVADGTESGTLPVSRTGSTGPSTLFIAQMFAFRGGLLKIESVSNNTGYSSTVTYNALVVNGNERTLIGFFAQNDDSGVGSPADYTAHTFAVPSIPTGEIGCFYKEDVDAAPAATSIGGSTEGWATVHLALFNVRGRSFIVN